MHVGKESHLNSIKNSISHIRDITNQEKANSKDVDEIIQLTRDLDRLDFFETELQNFYRG